MLNQTSENSPACWSNVPFFVPDQPWACTLLTSWPASAASRTGGILVKQNVHGPE